jgi:hypothetical protein
MSYHTELEVFFRTTNKNPLQELRGIFNKQWEGSVGVKQVEGGWESVAVRGDWFNVTINELSLMESLGIIKAVKEHCNLYNREITLVVKYGVIHDFDSVKLRR